MFSHQVNYQGLGTGQLVAKSQTRQQTGDQTGFKPPG